MNYATFWQRFVAGLIDFLILLPLVVVQQLLESASKGAAFALLIPMGAAYAAYSIYCHGRFGQTVGKRVMGIQVMLTTGARIGWREAWLRSSVELFFSLLVVIGTFTALAAIPDTEYYGVGWMQRRLNLAAHEPAWLGAAVWGMQIWVWSEVIVMLFNPRRRALHDYIAGTVVTKRHPVPAAQTHEAAYETVAQEMQQKSLRPGLWARAVAETGDEGAPARALYIRLRVAELIQQEQTDHARSEAEAQQKADEERRATEAAAASATPPRSGLESAVGIACGCVTVLSGLGMLSYALEGEWGGMVIAGIFLVISGAATHKCSDRT